MVAIQACLTGELDDIGQEAPFRHSHIAHDSSGTQEKHGSNQRENRTYCIASPAACHPSSATLLQVKGTLAASRKRGQSRPKCITTFEAEADRTNLSADLLSTSSTSLHGTESVKHNHLSHDKHTSHLRRSTAFPHHDTSSQAHIGPVSSLRPLRLQLAIDFGTPLNMAKQHHDPSTPLAGGEQAPVLEKRLVDQPCGQLICHGSRNLHGQVSVGVDVPTGEDCVFSGCDTPQTPQSSLTESADEFMSTPASTGGLTPSRTFQGLDTPRYQYTATGIDWDNFEEALHNDNLVVRDGHRRDAFTSGSDGIFEADTLMFSAWTIDDGEDNGDKDEEWSQSFGFGSATVD